jgi:hypothetical protein
MRTMHLLVRRITGRQRLKLTQFQRQFDWSGCGIPKDCG